ncbi:MAG TPA: VWA domain-containing protein [Anaerolineales bacterium]|nr:VWA domain-containing protein [Anaerolineales bacterium]
MPTHHLDNFYARLGLHKTASGEEIQTAYRLAARKYHPDTNPNSGAKELFLLVQEAYNILSDPDQRRAYDTTLPAELDESPPLMVNTLYSRSQITPGEPEQVVYVLLDLMAADNQDLNRPPLNVCLVLDTSTSMAGPRLNQVMKAALQFLEQLQPQDLVSVVSFNDYAELVIPAQRGRDQSRLRSRISTLQTRGGTEILQGLQAGLGEVQRNLNPNSVPHIVLITDGRTYGDEQACLQLASKAADLGVSISALGIGTEWNENFIDQLAARSGGSSLYADNAIDIHSLLERRFAQLNKSYANNVRIYHQSGPHSDLAYAFRLAPDLGMLATESPIALGSVPTEGSLSVLLEFEVDATRERSGEIFLAEGELRLDIPSRAVPAARARFELSRPVRSSSKPDAPPQALINAIGKLSLYRMQERARQDLEAGDSGGAAKRLRMLATRLLSSGEKGLARTVLLAAEEIKSSSSLDEKSGKQIKYGTRALIDNFGAPSRPGKTSGRRRREQ